MHILDWLEDAAGGRGQVRVLPEQTDPVGWDAVWRTSERVAAHLAERTDATVAAVLTPSLASFATIAGAWRAGRRLVSLPQPARGADLGEYAARIAQLCAAADVELLVTDDTYAALAAVVDVPATTFAALAGTPAPDVSLVPLAAGDVALVQFTSGSTGDAKAVPVTAGMLGAHMAALETAVDVPDGGLHCSWLPLSHDMGLIGSLLATWSYARSRSLSLAFIDTQHFLSRPSVWLDTCSALRATGTAAPGFAFDLAVRYLPRCRGPLDLSALHDVTTGAERVRAATLRTFADATAEFGFDPAAFNPAYGLAEATLAVTYTRPGEPWQATSFDPAAVAAGAVTLAGDGGLELVGNGTPLDGVSVTVDGDGFGEICVDGPSVFAGYLGGPARSGPHRTGDVGAVVDGHLYVLGRVDDQLSVRGRNLAGAELEAAAEAHPAVRAGSVAAVADDGGYALVVERPKRAEDGWHAALAQVRTTLARTTGVAPDRIVVVAPGALARTPSGKLRRRHITDELAAGTLPIEDVVAGRR